jgi:cytochrome c oxidase cbb3-type subunit 3
MTPGVAAQDAGNAPLPAIRYDQHVWAGGKAPPAGTFERPTPSSQETVKQGEQFFASFNCDGCHAGGAVGAVGPSLADGRWRYGGTDAAIFYTIFYGRPRGMPAFGGLLPADVIWSLVSYIRSLEPRGDVATVRWDP